MCLFFIMLAAGPRVAGLFWWLFAPTRWDTAFDNVLWPIFGLIFAPWTTLMWVSVAPLGETAGYDWVWIGFGIAADVMSIASSGYGNRSRVRG